MIPGIRTVSSIFTFQQFAIGAFEHLRVYTYENYLKGKNALLAIFGPEQLSITPWTVTIFLALIAWKCLFDAGFAEESGQCVTFISAMIEIKTMRCCTWLELYWKPFCCFPKCSLGAGWQVWNITGIYSPPLYSPWKEIGITTWLGGQSAWPIIAVLFPPVFDFLNKGTAFIRDVETIPVLYWANLLVFDGLLTAVRDIFLEGTDLR